MISVYAKCTFVYTMDICLMDQLAAPMYMTVIFHLCNLSNVLTTELHALHLVHIINFQT
jgi:hypothetical protein